MPTAIPSCGQGSRTSPPTSISARWRTAQWRRELQPLGFVSQARLLTSLGLLDRLAPLAHDAAGKAGAATRSTSGEPADAAEAAAQQLAWARQTQSVQVLLSEAEMGELFKAVAFGRSVGTAALGFARGDRMAALLAS